MKVIVLGAAGMLGHDLVPACQAAGFTTIGLDLPEVDITQPASLAEAIPGDSTVINCAAYTRVDDAEAEKELAFAINGEGAGNVAQVCKEKVCRLLHLSTDYVFNGEGEEPYRENDPTDPINVYGASKLDGEQRVAAALNNHLIIRVQSLFGRSGPNFVKAISRKLEEEQPELRVVNDQISAPTYTGHLAKGIVTLLQGPYSGKVHVSASGHCSWYEFACAIAARLRPDIEVQPVSTAEFPRPARRPAHGVMDTRRFKGWTGGQQMPTWEEGLNDYLKET